MIKMKIFIVAAFVCLISACNFPMSNSPEPSPTGIENPGMVPTSTEIPATATFTPVPTATLAPVPVTPQISIGPDNFPENVNPLTGLNVPDPALLNRSPLAVKIQIFPRGQRPPIGVSLADIVYDYYQNNGLSRFHAIFLGNDVQQVGPIRSARLLDGQLVSMYKSIFAFGGADRRILNKLYNTSVANRMVVEGYGNCPPLCRVDPNGYNYLVTNTSDLSNFASQQGIPNERQNLNGMFFSTVPPEGGQPGSQLSVRYSISAYTRWDYDPNLGRFLRLQDTNEAPEGVVEGFAPLFDQLTGQQIAADNVVVLFATHEFLSGSVPGKNEIVEINLSSSGPAVAFRDGLRYDVTWNTMGDSSPLFLTFPDGSLYPFKPGNTWFQVVGQSSTSEIQEGNLSRFQSNFP